MTCHHRAMARPIFVVDAFAAGPFRGNPAGVVLLEQADAPEDALMLVVAAEMKHSETAFVRPRPDGAFDLRWFTPEVEVDLCGHATLATAHVLWETDRLAPYAAAVFHTRGGVLRATRRADGAIELDFPTAPPERSDLPAGLLDALGLERLGPGGVESLRTTGQFFMVVVPDAATVRKLEPDFAAMRALADVRGVYVTAPGDDGEHDIVSRCFAPRVGIDEDPVTGSMHCVLSAFWCERLAKPELRAEQASARGGTVGVRQAGDRTLLLGQAVTVLRGELLV
jgi:PhzF family phenazine biosynthesis protein